MQKVLVIVAHPALHKSKVNRHLIEGIKDLTGVTVHDLYNMYPDFYIHIRREQKLLMDHDIIVWHHPLYWYSCPALLKEWLDLVLEHGFAYGKNGTALRGKWVFNSVTTGGSEDAYSQEGRNHYTLQQFLAPFHQTAMLCGMKYLPPYVVHGVHLLNPQNINLHAQKYRKAITDLQNRRLDENSFSKAAYLNELI